MSAANIRGLPPTILVAESTVASLREALRQIAFLRPAGDTNGIKLKDAQRLIETIERIALDALGEGL